MKFPNLHLSKTVHVLAHIGLIAIQVGNASSGFIPFPFNVAVAGSAALAQGIIAVSQHQNPIGG